MKLLEFFSTLRQPLTEKRRSKPILVYHGTSADNARSILKHGMITNPRSGRWKDEKELENSSQLSSTRASLNGSYWTSNLGTAKSSATNTLIAKYPRSSGVDWRTKDALIVIAQAVEQSALADEDSVRMHLQSAWSMMMSGALKVAMDAIRIAALCWYGEPEKYRSKMIEKFEEYMHEHLAWDAQPILKGFAEEYISTEILRQLAHYLKGMSDYDRNSFFRDFPEGALPPIPKIADAERAHLAVIDRGTKYYRKSAYKSDAGWSHTLRMNHDVGFAGRTKIIAMVTYNITDKSVRLIYGKSLPEDFIRQWENTTGPFPGLTEGLNEEELSVTEYGHNVKIEVIRNPTVDQLLGFTKRARNYAVRGLLGPGDTLYVWQAYYGNHDVIGKAMSREWGVNYSKAKYIHMEFSLIDPRVGISTDIAQSGMKRFGPLWCTPSRKFSQSYWGVVLAKRPAPSHEEHDQMIKNVMTVSELKETDLPDDWTLGGGWIDDEGEFHEVNHAKDHHHRDISLDQFGQHLDYDPDDEDDMDFAADQAYEMAVNSGWVWMSVRAPNRYTPTHGIEIQWTVPSVSALKGLLGYVNGRKFDVYRINNNEMTRSQFLQVINSTIGSELKENHPIMEKLFTDGDFSYLLNPSAGELLGYMRKKGELRGVLSVTNGVESIYVWSAEDYIHTRAIWLLQQSGIPLDSRALVYLYFSPEEYIEADESWHGRMHPTGDIWVGATNGHGNNNPGDFDWPQWKRLLKGLAR